MDIRIDVRIVSSGNQISITLSDNKTLDQVIDKLITQNLLKTHDSGGNKLNYKVELQRLEKTLQSNQTLEELKVRDGDLLLLVEKSDKIVIENKTDETSKKNLNSIPRIGSFVLGSGLIILGIIDGISNPFAFVTAPELFLTGGTLITLSVTGKKD